MSRPALLACCLAAGVLLVNRPSAAAEFCATTSAELATALATARSNGQNDVVRIAVGTYLTPGQPFHYSQNVSGDDGMGVIISGGWTEFFGNACGQQLPGNYQDTILDGQDANRVFSVVLTASGSFALRRVKLRNGSATGDGGGMLLTTGSGFTGKATVEGVLFEANQASVFAGGLMLRANGSHLGVTLANNVFIFNSADCRFGAAKLEQSEGTATSFFLNNTFVYNFHGDSCANGLPGSGGADFYAEGPGEHQVLVNNLFWGNESLDVAVRGGPGAASRYERNNHGSADLGAAGATAANLSLNPQLVFVGSGIFQFPTHRLQEGSPMVDAGSPPPTFWTVLQDDEDVDGQPRVTGRAIDIGAFEQPTPIFGSGFEETPAPM